MMKGNIVGCNTQSGISFPNFEKIVKAYDVSYMKILDHQNIDEYIKTFLNHQGPIVCEVFMDENEVHEPKVMATVDANGNITPGNLEDIKWIMD